MKYQTKPVAVEAIQWNGPSHGDISSWALSRKPNTRLSLGDSIFWVWPDAGEEMLTLAPTDWLIFNGKSFDACGDQGFKNKYKECE